MTTVTDRIYGAQTAGVGRTVQDIGLCDLQGEYVYTAKTRMKGLMLVVFVSPDSAPSVQALETIQAWTQDVPAQKWTPLAVADGTREELAAFAAARGISGVSILVDHELYQTRTWGVSHLPSIYLISPKGRVLMKVIGDRAADLSAVKQRLTDEIGRMVEAEEAAKRAEAEKKAAEEAKKTEEAQKA